MKIKIYPLLFFCLIYIVGNMMVYIKQYGFSMLNWIILLFYVINTIHIFFSGFFIFPLLAVKEKRISGILLLLLSFPVFASLHYLNENFLEPLIRNQPGKTMLPYLKFAFQSLPYFIFDFVLATGFYYYKMVMKERTENEYQRALLFEAQATQFGAEARARQMENDVLLLKLKQLRAQLNPHFLRNTLISIQSYISDENEKAANQIAMLAELMDYFLKEPTTDNREPLEQEIRAIELLLNLVREQYLSSFSVEFEKQGNTIGYRIISNVLVTLVENLVKYGYINNPEKPARIQLRIHNHQLRFSLFNWIKAHKPETANGIGTRNIKRMLELAYPEKFTYTIKENDTTYQSELTIIL
jgi:Histidine kinase